MRRPASPPLPPEQRAALVEDLARLVVADLARRPVVELLVAGIERNGGPTR